MPDRTLGPGELLFLGTGEAFDQDLPNTSVLCCLGPTILVDCGHTIPPLLWRALPDPERLDAIYLTHLHGDHTFGVPSVLYRFWEDGRRRPLVIIGQRGIESYLANILNLAYRIEWKSLSYPIRFMTVEPGVPLTYRGLRLSFAKSNHSIVNLAIRFDWNGKAVAISGDGSPTDSTKDLFQGCSVVIHETFQDEIFQPVHASLPSVIATVRAAGVKKLYLVHLSRRFSGIAAKRLKSYRDRFMGILIARPGQIVRV